MKTDVRSVIDRLELSEIYEVAQGKVKLHGFFAQQFDGTYAWYGYQHSEIQIGQDRPYNDGPIIEEIPYKKLLRRVSGFKKLRRLDLKAVTATTPEGFYYE